MVNSRHFARFIGVLFPVGIHSVSFYVMNTFVIGVIYIGIWDLVRNGEWGQGDSSLVDFTFDLTFSRVEQGSDMSFLPQFWSDIGSFMVPSSSYCL